MAKSPNSCEFRPALDGTRQQGHTERPPPCGRFPVPVRKRGDMPSDNEFDELLHVDMTRLVKSVAPNDFAVEQALDNVTKTVVNLIPEVNCADILPIEDGNFQSMAPTPALACELDAAQRQLMQGPCLAAAVADSTVRCPDLRDEARWPEFAAAAIRLGVYSMLSFQLYTARGRSGALNLVGYTPHDLSMEAQAIGAMLATHAAMALMGGQARSVPLRASQARHHWPSQRHTGWSGQDAGPVLLRALIGLPARGLALEVLFGHADWTLTIGRNAVAVPIVVQAEYTSSLGSTPKPAPTD